MEDTEKVFGAKQESFEFRITADQKIATYQNGILLDSTSFELQDSYNEGFFKMAMIDRSGNFNAYGIVEFCEDMLAFKIVMLMGVIIIMNESNKVAKKANISEISPFLLVTSIIDNFIWNKMLTISDLFSYLLSSIWCL
ncbi:MAG: hypothetical protein U5M51_16900, partial [Emticicia sp.]|nr:hypothetical protein [Emticicia sp.]